MRTDLIIVGGVVAFAIWYDINVTGNDVQDEDVIDTAKTLIDQVTGGGSPDIQNMQTSERMLGMLMRREQYARTPYQLDDGAGMTWGYGHKGQRGETPPGFISKDDAANLFADDVKNRAEKWVKLYVTIDLYQQEFDALVSIAFNMSPQSFKKFADSVNGGNGIDGIANDSIAWVKAVYTNGIRNRRTEELNVYNNGIYT